MRALVYASLVASECNHPDDLVARLGQPTGASVAVLEAAKENVAMSFNGQRPRVLDLFAGGGTIPLEALRLGADSYAVDSNQLAAFINACNLQWATRQEPAALRTMLDQMGNKVLSIVADLTAVLFPLRGSSNIDSIELPITTYLWSYSTKCRNCGYRFSLSKRPWLSRKNGRRLCLHRSLASQSELISVRELLQTSRVSAGNWIGRSGKAKCPRCGWRSEKLSLDDCRDELLALVGSRRGKGKQFAAAHCSALPTDDRIAAIEAELLKEIGEPLPISQLPHWSGIVNPAVYGMRTHADALNPRQRVVLLALLCALKRVFRELTSKHGEDFATGVVSLLSGLVDQCVDWNCRLSMWISQNEQVGRAFCGPGISMLWDYAETDPVSEGPSNLRAKLERIIEGAVTIAGIGDSATVVNGYAQELPFKDNYFDAIVTDPPYYDNIYYTVLADFFFAWKRLLLRTAKPGFFSPQTTDTSRELVASRSRDGDEAHEQYCTQLAAAFCEAARTLKPEGVFSLVYSHASLPGWQALIDAFCRSPLVVTSVQPLSIERRQRPRAMTSQAVNTCLVFVARKRPADCKLQAHSDLLAELDRAIDDRAFRHSLNQAGWSEHDIALALFGQGVGVLCNAKAISASEQIELLGRAEELVQRSYHSFKLARRHSL
ncbi:MAG: DUF1156 domain-containing protein [Proteobacteria bacterium]|nr:DUF1156 domain-containing protein [Pseudomonadota bacterium]